MCSDRPLLVNVPVLGGSCNHGIRSVIFSSLHYSTMVYFILEVRNEAKNFQYKLLVLPKAKGFAE